MVCIIKDKVIANSENYPHFEVEDGGFSNIFLRGLFYKVLTLSGNLWSEIHRNYRLLTLHMIYISVLISDFARLYAKLNKTITLPEAEI